MNVSLFYLEDDMLNLDTRRVTFLSMHLLLCLIYAAKQMQKVLFVTYYIIYIFFSPLVFSADTKVHNEKRFSSFDLTSEMFIAFHDIAHQYKYKKHDFGNHDHTC